MAQKSGKLFNEDPKNPFPNGIKCQLAAVNAGDFVLLGGSNLAEFEQRQGNPVQYFLWSGKKIRHVK